MINALHLPWIIPLSGGFGLLMAAIFAVGGDMKETWIKAIVMIIVLAVILCCKVQGTI